MQVKSSDGERLGKVVACQPNGFVVEKGFLFPKDLLVPYERISDIRSGEILISLARGDLTDQGARPTAAATTAATVGAAASGPAEEVGRAARSVKEAASNVVDEARAALGGNDRADRADRGDRAKRATFEQFGKSEEILVPLIEEEIVASKHVEKVGDVHIRKEIITEEKQITVPVTREVLRVERVAVNHEVRAGDRAFERESFDIPISEEHVTLEKHAVVREEIHIGKDIQQGEEMASTTVRREQAEIETTGPVRRAEVPSNDTSQLRATGTGGLKR
jgi:uncharacterized protein (TIGR02271 family)